MKIQDVERKTGLDRASIRFYEKEGLLTPKRLENGYREYTEEDMELLKKIKLLRRLGMSLEKIRQLQKGSENLNSAVSAQIARLTDQIDDHKRCRAVCQAMQQDGAVFSSLDAEHYLRLLQEIRINDRALSSMNFQEDVAQQIHPWRRWFARMLDYGLCNGLIRFIIIVILRVRPVPGEFISTLITIAGMVLYIPAEAWMISTCGTTPGKWAMGIRLEYIQGGNFPFSFALNRSAMVFAEGMGCGIPILEPILMIRRFCELTGRRFRRFARYDEVQKPQEMPWDDQTEFIYVQRDLKREVAVILLILLQLGSGFWCVADGIKPKYRGSELTVAQFSENYNGYISIFQENGQMYDKLDEDGKRRPVPQGTVIVDLNGEAANPCSEFTYETENGVLRSVILENSWDDVFFLMPLSGEALHMASSLLLAQDGCGIVELEQFTNLYTSYLDEKNVAFTYKNLTIAWKIETDSQFLQGTIVPGERDDSEVAVFFQVTIHPK